MEELLPEAILNEAYERMIGLIVRDSHLLKREVVEINIYTNHFYKVEKKDNEVFSVLFRKTSNSHTMVGVNKLF